MSRIGKKPIPLPKGVSYAVEGNTVTVTGPKGKVTTHMPAGVKLETQDGRLVVLLPADTQVTGWVNGRAVKFQAGKASDPKALVPFTAAAGLKAGKNDLRLRIAGGNREALAAITTLGPPEVALALAGRSAALVATIISYEAALDTADQVNTELVGWLVLPFAGLIKTGADRLGRVVLYTMNVFV